MEIEFLVGMEVYDPVLKRGVKGVVTEVDKNSITVNFGDQEITYLKDGRYFSFFEPTLSTSDYSLPLRNMTQVKYNYHNPNDNRVYRDKEMSEAFDAFYELALLRDEARNGWVPDWKDNHERKYIISIEREDEVVDEIAYYTSNFLSFPTDKVRDKFLEDHHDLILKAKELL